MIFRLPSAQVEVVAAYGKTELWQAAQSCQVSDFDLKTMPPSEAFLPSSVPWPWRSWRGRGMGFTPMMLQIMYIQLHTERDIYI